MLSAVTVHATMLCYMKAVDSDTKRRIRQRHRPAGSEEQSGEFEQRAATEYEEKHTCRAPLSARTQGMAVRPLLHRVPVV